MIKQINQLELTKDERVFVVGVKEGVTNPFEKIITKLANTNKQFFDLGNVTTFYPIHTEYQTPKIMFVGLGKKEDYSLPDVQKVVSKVYPSLKESSIILLDTFQSLNEDLNILTEQVSETITLVQYEFSNYKTKDELDNEIVKKEIFIYSDVDVSQAIKNGVINGEATNHARTLVNEPRNKMTTYRLAEYAEKLAKELGLEYKIYNKKEIEELGMGAFLAVNQGSKQEARLIHLMYRGNPNSEDITTLVGKGVTYDSGGYSIKPKNGMAGMKSDMAGSAAVLGAIEAISRKQLKVNVDVVIAATDNLINSDAIVPDDVIVTMSGKTIEILNTDAEGRLTLVDAITFAKSKQASRIIDVATLTGGVITALGFDITGSFTNDEAFHQQLKQAAEKAGEDIWQLPVDQFRERCRKSDVADYNNSPGRDGHASFGAALLAEFAEDTPWIHLDIAGTSYKSSSHLLGPSGGTGVMVRTLTKFFE